MRLTQRGPALTGDAQPSDRGQAVAVLRRAVELGVSHIDTAGFCFSPFLSANELINSALAPYPDDLVIATKVGPRRDGRGRERRPAGAEPARLLAIAAAHGATLAQVRLAWTLHQGGHVLAIPGTGSVEYLMQNLAAGSLRLPAGELSSLAAPAGGRCVAVHPIG